MELVEAHQGDKEFTPIVPLVLVLLDLVVLKTHLAVAEFNMPAADTEAAITLTFSEAFHGTQKRLQLNGETINVRIPPGAQPGSRIRIKGKGQY